MATKATELASVADAPVRPLPPRAWWPAKACSAFSTGASSEPPWSTRRHRGLLQHFSRSSSVFLAMNGRRSASSRSSRTRSYSDRKYEPPICETPTPLERNMMGSSACSFLSFQRCLSVRPDAMGALQSTTPNFISPARRCATASTLSGSGFLSSWHATAQTSPEKKTPRSCSSLVGSSCVSGSPPPPPSRTTATKAAARPRPTFAPVPMAFFFFGAAVPPQSSATAGAFAPEAAFFFAIGAQ
mmetsp:Transcript_36741/g.113664  ORF Transcript_36741/g.113664 Transcript_36741/m.113664 type:complete len:243 (+) Transcript_36741:606-1334(+)